MKEEFWVLMAKETASDEKLFKRAIRQIMISYDYITKYKTKDIARQARDNFGYGKPDDIIRKVTMTIEVE